MQFEQSETGKEDYNYCYLILFCYPYFLFRLVVLPFQYLSDPNPAHAESQ